MVDGEIENLRYLASLVRAEDQMMAPYPPPEPSPYLSASAGTLSAETVRRALDDLWHKRLPDPPAGYRGGREPFGSVRVTIPDAPWTVEAGGWKLIIRDGAMTGLERTGGP